MENKKNQGELEEYNKFSEKLAVRKQWRQKHLLSQIKVGDKVDVRDTEYVWCKAIVELKVLSESRKPLLYVHYEGWNRKYDEYIYIDSKRIAPSGTYTSRKDIPRYFMCPHSNQMYGHIIEGGEHGGDNREGRGAQGANGVNNIN